MTQFKLEQYLSQVPSKYQAIVASRGDKNTKVHVLINDRMQLFGNQFTNNPQFATGNICHARMIQT